MLAWPVRIASVVALTVLAYGWGDWFASEERPAVDGILLALLTLILFVALARLYRPGGLAAFEPVAVRASGEPVTETAPAAVIAPRRESRKERSVRRERERRERREREEAVAPTAPFAEPVRAQEPEPARPPAPAREAAPLWAGERSAPGPPAVRAPRADDGPLDLNAASAEELAMLPGIGRGAAARVVEHRSIHGPFRSLGELAGVEGFDDSRVARVASRLRV